MLITLTTHLIVVSFDWSWMYFGEEFKLSKLAECSVILALGGLEEQSPSVGFSLASF